MRGLHTFTVMVLLVVSSSFGCGGSDDNPVPPDAGPENGFDGTVEPDVLPDPDVATAPDIAPDATPDVPGEPGAVGGLTSGQLRAASPSFRVIGAAGGGLIRRSSPRFAAIGRTSILLDQEN